MKFPHQIVVLDKKIERWLPLVLILLVVLLIRLPSFFEPVWYLDETIYLTIGNALNDGQVLYRDIVDHKTPVIYYLAKVGGQTQFRLLLTFWMLTTTAGVFILLTKIGLHKKLVWLATLGFGVATSLPIFEGLLPNGELFVMGFVVVSLVLLSNSRIWGYAFKQKQRVVRKKTSQIISGNNQSFISSTESQNSTSLQSKQLRNDEIVTSFQTNKTKLFLGGFLLGLAILTKVPAVFDVMGVAVLIYVGFWHQRSHKSFLADLKNYLWSISPELLWVTLGIATPIVISILYFAVRGAGTEYLQYGLLYNFRYAGTWVPTRQPILNTLLTLPAKIIFLLLSIILITRWQKMISPLVFWSSLWFILALIAATLSNRPYPHYFVQVLLPLTFLLTGFFQVLTDWWEKKVSMTATHKGLLATGFLTTILISLFIATWMVLHVWYYPTISYYLKFSRFITGQISLLDYWQSFSFLVKDNYQVAQLLKENNIQQLYIWGTNPSLYALTKTYPSDQFTVLFHITDLNHQSQTTTNLITSRPQVIAIMKDAEQPPPPQLNSFIHSNYRPWLKLEHLTLWRLREAV